MSEGIRREASASRLAWLPGKAGSPAGLLPFGQRSLSAQLRRPRPDLPGPLYVEFETSPQNVSNAHRFINVRGFRVRTRVGPSDRPATKLWRRSRPRRPGDLHALPKALPQSRRSVQGRVSYSIRSKEGAVDRASTPTHRYRSPIPWGPSSAAGGARRSYGESRRARCR